uniref:Uncharacterized protein n=1 Tax=Tanacetum cinerariifolium TaxID=118510 RepID=A0A6L2KIC5_TANCI|nr:hypothetical protein [Tanacetum cinerariifolium]
MSQPAEQAQRPANFAFWNTIGKGSKQAPDSNPGYLPADKLREICEKLQPNPTNHGGKDTRKPSSSSWSHVTDNEKLERKEGQVRLPRPKTPITHKTQASSPDVKEPNQHVEEAPLAPRCQKSGRENMQAKKEALSQASRPETATKEGKKREISFEAMSRVAVNVREKSKEYEMKRIGQTADEQSVSREPPHGRRG